jgi:transcriptional regulator with GAF, ATPase, and Fis domain
MTILRVNQDEHFAFGAKAMNLSSDSTRDRMIYELGNMFTTHLGLEELIPLVVSKCREVLDAGGVSVLLLDEERNELYFPYVSEEDPEVARRLVGVRIPADAGLAGTVLRTGRAERVDAAQSDCRFYPGVDRETGITTRSLLAVPLLNGTASLGVIEAVNPHGRDAFNNTDLALLEGLALSIGVAIQNARRFGEVKASAERLRVQIGALRRDLARQDRFAEIIAVSPAMAEVFRLMEGAACSSIPVLIEGETGTGKELVARGIHRASSRADAPFVALNCAALPEALLESELFGHRRGAFTGASEDRPGLFRAANGGVILLDEIGEMPLAMQAKLLRVLQENEVTSVGDTRSTKIDVRVISVTNRDLKAAQAARAFRQDLYYRLAAFPIRLPPLRERREDIPFLAARFLELACERHRKSVRCFDASAIDMLSHADWVGNVRELQNEIERVVALAADGETITVHHLSPGLRPAEVYGGATAANSDAALSQSEENQASALTGQPCSENNTPAATSLQHARAAFEARFISQILGEHAGNVSHAAVALGVSRVALQKKMKRYRLR